MLKLVVRKETARL